ncbi:MAG: MBL fold metallo-hydrolase [Bacteroidota bacterium]|nr:MBL fold metallo-hydrolase [Bacteroidota bacterium]
MKITTLIENLVYINGLYAEHGLSFLIDTGTEKILFDTGQTDAFMHNARKLGIDIADIDKVVISHGHYDHTGGLYSFLQENTKARVFIKKEAFTPKYKEENSQIGITYDPMLLDGRIEYVERTIEIAGGIFILPSIPLSNPADTNFNHFKIRAHNRFVNDTFEDELFVVIRHNNKISIISSCSHRGITNICNEAIKQFNLPVQLILGGFHLKGSTDIHQYNSIKQYFEKIVPDSIGVCHCTGVEKFADLLTTCSSQVFYNSTGNQIIL